MFFETILELKEMIRNSENNNCSVVSIIKTEIPFGLTFFRFFWQIAAMHTDSEILLVLWNNFIFFFKWASIFNLNLMQELIFCYSCSVDIINFCIHIKHPYIFTSYFL